MRTVQGMAKWTLLLLVIVRLLLFVLPVPIGDWVIRIMGILMLIALFLVVFCGRKLVG